MTYKYRKLITTIISVLPSVTVAMTTPFNPHCKHITVSLYHICEVCERKRQIYERSFDSKRVALSKIDIAQG